MWPLLLALSDKHGVLDVTAEYLAGVTGLPIDDILACLKRFCEPDPKSRTKSENGARLTLIDADRDWGWVIVNKGKYREKARLLGKAEREVESGANAARLRDRRGPPKNAADRPSDADADLKKKTLRGPSAIKLKRCPQDFLPDLAFALSEIPDVDADREAAKFKDWEYKTARSDWAACWRTWIRTAKDRGQYSKRGNGAIAWR